jgi:integrase
MNRIRKSNRGLPKRVYVKDGAYRYLSAQKIKDPADGEMKFWIRLGSVKDGEVKMLAALAALLRVHVSDEGSMPHLCEEFKAKKLARYTDEVQAQYKRFLDVIAEDFRAFTVVQVSTKHCADFLRNNFADKANTARKYGALMSKLFRYAISALGLREDNPMDQIDLDEFEVERRTFLATHDQVAAIRAAGFIGADGRKTQSGPMFACIIDLTYLLWARAIDIRMLKESQIEDGRIRVKPSKTDRSSGLTVDIIITPEIQAVIDRARAIKKVYKVISPYLLPSKKGTPYVKSGLTSMWDRARERAAATAAEKGEKFDTAIQFKDLRSLGATDAARQGKSRDDIQQRLVHTSGKTTDIYIKESVPTTSSIDMKLPWKSL